MNEIEPQYFKKFREQLETHEPLYFKQFREQLDKKWETYEPQYFKEFRKQLDEKLETRFDKIDETLESHSEQIGELKVTVTKIEMLLAKKADHNHTKTIEKKVEALEKAVFA